MPTYDFNCAICNKTHEVSCLMKDRDKPKPCPECKVDMDRVYAALDHFYHDCEQPGGYVNRER